MVEDIEDSLVRHEAIILRRERYGSDTEYKRDVGWWMFYTHGGCEKLKQLLQNPDYADQYEEIRALLEKRVARLNNLERILTGDEK